jgi:hypothetical protein
LPELQPNAMVSITTCGAARRDNGMRHKMRHELATCRFFSSPHRAQRGATEQNGISSHVPVPPCRDG